MTFDNSITYLLFKVFSFNFTSEKTSKDDKVLFPIIVQNPPIIQNASLGTITASVLATVLLTLVAVIIVLMMYRRHKRKRRRQNLKTDNMRLEKRCSEELKETSSISQRNSSEIPEQPTMKSLKVNPHDIIVPTHQPKCYKRTQSVPFCDLNQNNKPMKSSNSKIDLAKRKISLPPIHYKIQNFQQGDDENDSDDEGINEEILLSSSLTSQNEAIENDNENGSKRYESRKSSSCKCRDHSIDSRSYDAFADTENNDTSNVSVEKLATTPIRKSRKRLLSLQTSFESEPSESCNCDSCNCVVTEVKKLGNGIVKKTVYLYEIDDIDTPIVDEVI